MKKRIFPILLIITALFACPLLSLSAMGGEIIVSAQVDGGEPSALESGDIVHVTVILPKVENTSKLQFDLVFNNSVLEYNCDADADAVLSLLNIGKIEAVGDDTVRLVAAGLSSVSFESGTVAVSASFTVKQGVSAGEKEAFSLAGLKCADESVDLMADSVKIEIFGSDQVTGEVTAADETTSPHEITISEDTTAPPNVTTATETTAASEITTAETTGYKDPASTREHQTETAVPNDTAEESSVELTDEIDTVITTVNSPGLPDADADTTTDEVVDGGVPIVIPTVIVLAAACVLAFGAAFLFSKRFKLPK